MPDLALFYDHAEWLIPLQRVLDARRVDYVGIDVAGHSFDPSHIAPPAPIIFNRISMSSFKRTADHPIFYADALLGAWERAGARIINGGEAFAIDHNKARQLEIIASLGLKAPDTRVVRRREDIASAAQTIGFPLLVKGNIGGAGAGIVRFDSASELKAAALPDSIDKVWLVQGYHTPQDGHIIRFEFIGETFVYAIAVDGGGQFDLCPADACVSTPGKPVVTMTKFEPSEEQIEAARSLVRAAGIDVGGCEALIDQATGELIFYDINAFSNFAANAVELLGFDPHEQLADMLEAEITVLKETA